MKLLLGEKNDLKSEMKNEKLFWDWGGKNTLAGKRIMLNIMT